MNLFINGEVLKSAEGTTQDDPMAMAVYAIGITPLIDDCTGCSTLQDQSQWWSKLNELGPQYGYFPNASTSVLLVKPEHLNRSKPLFSNSNLTTVTDGACVLGTSIASAGFVTK